MFEGRFIPFVASQLSDRVFFLPSNALFRGLTRYPAFGDIGTERAGNKQVQLGTSLLYSSHCAENFFFSNSK